MSILASLPYVPILCSLAGLAAVGLLFFAIPKSRVRMLHGSRASGRPCRYCFFGSTEILEKKSCIEGDDLVEIQCFVCASCGLPQWTVRRGPVLVKHQS